MTDDLEPAISFAAWVNAKRHQAFFDAATRYAPVPAPPPAREDLEAKVLPFPLIDHRDW